VAAPGGDRREFYGTDQYKKPSNTVLAPYPEAIGRATGDIDANGDPTTPFVVKDSHNGQTAYQTDDLGPEYNAYCEGYWGPARPARASASSRDVSSPTT
jgi:hypothetical protein